MRQPIQLRHDSFARTTLMRAVSPIKYQNCMWCGENKKTTYDFYWQDDNGNGGTCAQPGRKTGPFCSIGCWELYVDAPSIRVR